MLKRFFIIGLLLTIFVFTAAAQQYENGNGDGDTTEFLGVAAAAPAAPLFRVSGDITTIYAFGNAISSGEDHQRISVEPIVAGAFFNDPSTGTRKNGFFTTTNLHVTFNPTQWLEGYFKLYAVHRPGSFYMPLQMENLSTQPFNFTVDAFYGEANVFGALGLSLPLDLILKAGKFKAEASQFGNISKYGTERVLFMMNTKTDFTYELTVASGPFSLSGSINYLFHQSVPRYYDEDGSFSHGFIALNEYAPQFLIAARVVDLNGLRAELLYGQNVSNIYSGHAAGASARYALEIGKSITVPLGLSFAFHEKNIDLLGQAAIAEPLNWASSGIRDASTTMSFRQTIAASLGAGLNYKADLFNIEFNLAGSFYNIGHYYRDPLNILKASADAMFTFDGKYFVGAGIIFGNILPDTVWKTREDVTDEDENWPFNPEEHMGFEFYGGINLGNNSRFVVGFNNNKGISLNNMLETRHDAQLKFMQQGTTWGTDRLLEASSLYVKFVYRF
jgi:hypothetical protein